MPRLTLLFLRQGKRQIHVQSFIPKEAMRLNVLRELLKIETTFNALPTNLRLHIHLEEESNGIQIEQK